MIPPPLRLLDNHTLVVSATQLESMQTCPQLWSYRYQWRRERAWDVAARDGGKAFDAALNHRYSRAGGQPLPPDSPLLSEAEHLIEQTFEPLQLPDDEYRTAVRYKQVLRAYLAHYGPEPFDVIGQPQLPVSCELGWVPAPTSLVPGGQARVVLHGILDLLVRLHGTGQVLVMDTKTMNSWDQRQLNGFEQSGQPRGYAWMVQRLAALHPELGLPPVVHGFMLNAVVIRPPLIKERKDGSNLPREEFHRHVCYYQQEQLEDWRSNALLWVQTILGFAATGIYPRAEKSCANQYGRACAFLPVCSEVASTRALTLASDLYRDYKTAAVFGGPVVGAQAANVAGSAPALDNQPPS